MEVGGSQLFVERVASHLDHDLVALEGHKVVEGLPYLCEGDALHHLPLVVLTDLQNEGGLPDLRNDNHILRGFQLIDTK